MTIIFLAAGLSRRMGNANKLLLPYGDGTIVQTTLENILVADIGNIIVVVGHEADKVKSVLEKYSVLSFVRNPKFSEGMTSSIQAGLNEAKNDSEGYMICLSDMVFIKPEEYKQIAEFFLEALKNDAQCIVQPQFNGIPGNPIVFSNFYKTEIAEHKNPEGCREIVQKHNSHLKKIDMSTDNILRDIDDREEYNESIKYNV